MSALVTLTTANMDIVYKDMVTKAQQVGGTCNTTETVVLMYCGVRVTPVGSS